MHFRKASYRAAVAGLSHARTLTNGATLAEREPVPPLVPRFDSWFGHAEIPHKGKGGTTMPFGFTSFVFVVTRDKFPAYEVHSLHFTFAGAEKECREAAEYVDDTESDIYWMWEEVTTRRTVPEDIRSTDLVKYGAVELYRDGVPSGYKVQAREVEA